MLINNNNRTFFWGLPMVWLMLFLVFPLLILLFYSFCQRGDYGELKYIFTVENYLKIFNLSYLKIFSRTLIMALLNCFICFLVGFPLALFISKQKNDKLKYLYLLLLTFPFWSNFLSRTYAWLVLLRSEGILSHLLQWLGLIKQPLELLYTPAAVQLGLFYNYVPFMVFPIFAAIEKIDDNLIFAAKDLGCSDLQVLKKIIFPLSLHGIGGGLLLVFIPSFGEFVIPDILGGAKTNFLGNIIRNQFSTARDLPFGSALAVFILIMSTLIFWLNSKILAKNE